MNPTLLRLLRFLKPYAGQVTLSILAGLATVASGTALMATAAYLIAAAALQPSIADLQVAIVGVRFFGISRGIFRYLERLLTHTVNLDLLASLRVWFYQSIEPLAPARLQTRHSGDLLSSAVADIETLENLYVRVVAPVVIALLAGGGIFLFLSRFDLRLALALIGFLVTAGLGLPLLSHRLARRPGTRLVETRARLHTQTIETLQGAADLIVYGQAGAQLERLAALDREFSDAQRQMAWIRGFHGMLTTLLTHLAGWSLLLLAIPLIRQGRLDGDYLAAIVLGSLASFEAVLPLPLAAQYLVSSLQAARRLFALADASAPVVDPVDPAPLPRSMGLSVRGLRFGYEPGKENLVLDGLDLEIPAGSSVALVGPSGAGKTTLTQLILRFWDYQEGEIRLAGRDLHCYAQNDVRSRIAVIAQKTYLFNTSVRQNLLLANPDANPAQIEAACRQAQIHEWIAGLPEGYETRLGERGLRISGGERQRIAIARALLKDAPLLILDEPVASLDAETARQVLHTLIETVLPGRTSLLITHHLSGLERMGAIYVLKAGRIVEHGAHDELLQSAGMYARMWQAQHRLVLEQS